MDQHQARQVDIAVELGVVQQTLPVPVGVGDFVLRMPDEPPQLIHGILHQGCKMILGGTSKSNKSWTLLDMAVSVASGVPWWGFETTQRRVLYVNFELPPWSLGRRLEAIGKEKKGLKLAGNLDLWNLRGRAADFAILRPELERVLMRYDYGLIILDPVYKLLGGRDENANGDIAGLMNEFERMSESTGAAVVMAHHFAKGDASGKQAIDRISGAGAWGRDPDCIVVLTPHEEEDCFTVTSILRNVAPIPEMVVRWEFPLLRPCRDLNPAALRSPAGRRKLMTDHDFMSSFVPGQRPVSREVVVREAGARGMSVATVDRYLHRLTLAGLLSWGSGMYWRKEEDVGVVREE